MIGFILGCENNVKCYAKELLKHEEDMRDECLIIEYKGKGGF